MAIGARAWDSPDAFRGAVQQFTPYPLLTGSAFSSHAPASWWFHQIALPASMAISNVNVFKSMNASVPGATSQNSSGSEGYSYSHGLSVFARQDYQSNSTNLVLVGTASFGLTATLTYSSTAQTFGMSWLTDATGGTAAYSTTSNAGNWSRFATGPKVIGIPWNTALSAGEYWFAHAHSSTTGTSNSNVTMLSFSNLHIAPQLVTMGVLGQSVTVGSVGNVGGIASAVTTNATMPLSVVSNGTLNYWVQQFSNA